MIYGFLVNIVHDTDYLEKISLSWLLEHLQTALWH